MALFLSLTESTQHSSRPHHPVAEAPDGLYEPVVAELGAQALDVYGALVDVLVIAPHSLRSEPRGKTRPGLLANSEMPKLPKTSCPRDCTS